MNTLHLSLVLKDEAMPFYRLPLRKWFHIVNQVGETYFPGGTAHFLVPNKIYKKISRMKVIDTSRRVEISFQKEMSLQKILCILGKEPKHEQPDLPTY